MYANDDQGRATLLKDVIFFYLGMFYFNLNIFNKSKFMV